MSRWPHAGPEQEGGVMKIIIKKGWVNVGEPDSLKTVGLYPAHDYHTRVFSNKRGALFECPDGAFPVRATLTFKVPAPKRRRR